jgi:hypothetical protein
MISRLLLLLNDLRSGVGELEFGIVATLHPDFDVIRVQLVCLGRCKSRFLGNIVDNCIDIIY